MLVVVYAIHFIIVKKNLHYILHYILFQHWNSFRLWHYKCAGLDFQREPSIGVDLQHDQSIGVDFQREYSIGVDLHVNILLL